MGENSNVAGNFGDRANIIEEHLTNNNSNNFITKELIDISANLAIALSFIVGLIFGISQVRAVARDRKERLILEDTTQFSNS